MNGIRAVERKGAWEEFLRSYPADIICLQETKAEIGQLSDELQNVPGYFPYFSSSKGRKGYSGVAIYTKVKPQLVRFGIDEPGHDDEGRVVVAHFENFVLLNVYFPNGGGGPVRLEYKLKFYDDFLAYIDRLAKEGKQVIFTGDVNTAHEAIDLARPKENEKNTGFLPIEREWIDEVIAHGYVDVFRHFNPSLDGVYTYWDMKTFARERNVGWRIDYFFLSKKIATSIQAVEILSEKYGSDHCPITINIKEIV